MNTETIRQQLQELRLKTAAAELEATLAKHFPERGWSHDPGYISSEENTTSYVRLWEHRAVDPNRMTIIAVHGVAQILSQDHTGFGVWLGDPFHDKESEQFVARYIERAPLSLDKLSLQDDIVTYTTTDGAAHEFTRRETLKVAVEPVIIALRPGLRLTPRR